MNRAAAEPVHIASRDNPLLVAIRKLVRDGGGYRRAGQVWLEGDHLVAAAVARGCTLSHLLVSESALARTSLPGPWRQAARRVAVVADRLWASLATLESPAAVGALVDLPAEAAPVAATPTLVLDRLQDPGNVGSILRSAAAFGFLQVLALKGTVALWSPKVLRAGMGAHFGLSLLEAQDPQALQQLELPLVATSSHAPAALPHAAWPTPCAWVFGHEGRGVDPALVALCAAVVRIPQPGGEESLNVAAAAAVCLYEDLRRRLRTAAGQ